jgi:hypothetical protein
MVLSGVSLAVGAGRIGRYHTENQPRGLSGWDQSAYNLLGSGEVEFGDIF